MELISSKFRHVFGRLSTVTQNQIKRTTGDGKIRGINLSQVLQTVRPSTSYPYMAYTDEFRELNTKYQVTQDPEDWKYVERVLPLTIIPEPVKKQKYPSGWKPQADDLKDRPYFVARTKNHMIPVYLRISQRGVRRHTYIRKIQGDIWLLEKELRGFLQKESFQPLRTQVHEFAGLIKINGDFVNAVKHWLEQRDF